MQSGAPGRRAQDAAGQHVIIAAQRGPGNFEPALRPLKAQAGQQVEDRVPRANLASRVPPQTEERVGCLGAEPLGDHREQGGSNPAAQVPGIEVCRIVSDFESSVLGMGQQLGVPEGEQWTHQSARSPRLDALEAGGCGAAQHPQHDRLRLIVGMMRREHVRRAAGHLHGAQQPVSSEARSRLARPGAEAERTHDGLQTVAEAHLALDAHGGRRAAGSDAVVGVDRKQGESQLRGERREQVEHRQRVTAAGNREQRQARLREEPRGAHVVAQPLDQRGIAHPGKVAAPYPCGNIAAMSQPIVVVDAFTDRPFAGNPAAVCLLAQPAEDGWMQQVAREMNLSETAFLVPEADAFRLRWFTPAAEVELCGHATLASAHWLWASGAVSEAQPLAFETLSGRLLAMRQGAWIALDFPAKPDTEAEPPLALARALGAPSVAFGVSEFDCVAEVASEDAVRQLRPDIGALAALPYRGVIVTARATTAGLDFVSRFFAPAVGVPEDPVTGSAHCVLGPYWRRRLLKDDFLAYQASPRGGVVKVGVRGDRVLLGGQAVTVWKGELL